MIKKLANIRTLIGLICISYALVLSYKPQKNNINLDILKLEKPSASIIESVTNVADLVSDPTDRAKLAIFNQEFGKRVLSYDIDTQKLNDLYVSAAGHFFENSLKDKYDGLDAGLTSLMKKVATDDNHSLTQEEKNKLSEYFLGLSWALVQKWKYNYNKYVI